MEVQKIRDIRRDSNGGGDEDDGVPLPGFRFHPTDEELVGFYLRRKVEKKPIRIELIKQIDIYKHDPWDLPKTSNVEDKEWYFFCKRGRKYRNSIRPNRVTGSGFWKATGIDRPIYSAVGEGRDYIGLKKSLVYYRGCAGKGTKTDWMMHEFRLPPVDIITPKNIDDKIIAQEAEVWTLCRILKRSVLTKKCIIADARSKTCSSVVSENWQDGYISFRPVNEKKVTFGNNNYNYPQVMNESSSVFQGPSSTTYSSFFSPDMNELLKHGDWDELKSVVEFGDNQHFI